MKFIILFVLLGILLNISISQPLESNITVTDKEWTNFKFIYNKHYEGDEDNKRRNTYLETKLTIDEHRKKYDAGEVNYLIGINNFADMTQQEKKQYQIRTLIDNEQEQEEIIKNIIKYIKILLIEEANRRELTKKTITEHQKNDGAGEVSLTLRINHFADITEEEVEKICSGLVVSSSS